MNDNRSIILEKIDKQLQFVKDYWQYFLLANVCMLIFGALVITKILPDRSLFNILASVLSGIVAVIDVLLLVKVVRRLVNSVSLIQNTYLTSRVSLLVGTFYNAVYVLLSLISGYLHQSVWYLIFAFYHLTFACVKFLIGKRFRKEVKEEDWNNYGRVGVFIIFSSGVFLSIFYFVTKGMDKVNSAFPLLVYLTALITFINFINSFSSLFRYRKNPSPREKSSKQISFTNSFFALFFLQTMMLKQFGEADSHESKLFLTYALGLSVLTILIGQGVFMIQKAKKQLKNLK